MIPFQSCAVQFLSFVAHRATVCKEGQVRQKLSNCGRKDDTENTGSKGGISFQEDTGKLSYFHKTSLWPP